MITSRIALRCTSLVSKCMSISGLELMKQCEKECVAKLGRPGPRKRSGMMKTGRRTAAPSADKMMGEESEVQVAETPVWQSQDLVSRTMPPGLGSLGWMIRATMELARLETWL